MVSPNQLQIALPVTFALILRLLFRLYHNGEFPVITVLGVALAHWRHADRYSPRASHGYFRRQIKSFEAPR